MRLRIRCFAETAIKNPKVQNNNGDVYLSARKLAEEMGCDPKTAAAALADLQAKGWIVVSKPHKLGVHGQGKAPHFRLTMMPTGQGKSLKHATKEPTQWASSNDFEVLVFASQKLTGRKGNAEKFIGKCRKKQKPAPDCGAALYQNVDKFAGCDLVSAPDCDAGNALSVADLTAIRYGAAL